MNRNVVLSIAVALLVAAGGLALGGSAYLDGKAQVGQWLVVERAEGKRIVYRVSDIAIVDARALAIPRDTERPTLTLITCYPFDALVPGGPLRYVVTAEAESPAFEITVSGPAP